MSELPFMEWEANEMHNEVLALRKENTELRQQLEASQALSEERRLALRKSFPGDEYDACIFCCADVTEHKPNCDYVRLIGGAVE